MQREIKIHYGDEETGPALLVADRVAVITDVPLLADNMWRGSVVQLDYDSRRQDGYASIDRVLYSPYPCQSHVLFRDEIEATVLFPLLRILGADIELGYKPDNGKPGMILVAHDKKLDPVALAEAIGISQADDTDQEPAS